ncbi:MAG: YabP/YqfC family sporulation protein [Lachnospiraceae bacterium]
MAFVMNREKKIGKDSLRHRITEATNMPKDVICGVPIVTITGQEEICVENYRGIIEYTELLIRIKTKIGQIKINGKEMKIEYYTNDEMKIIGRILSIEYQ